MKIAHIITRMIIGGAQENTLYNCLDLAEDFGDEVMLLTGPATGPEGKLLEQLPQSQRQKIRVQIVPNLQRSLSMLADPRAYFAIKRHLRDFSPQVVHTHSAKAGVLGRMAAWHLRVPAVVHTVHGAPFYPYQNRLAYWAYRWSEWYAAGHCHHLISVADAMTRLMVDAGVATPDRFTTIYSGMEVSPFVQAQQQRLAVRQQLGFQDHDLVIGKIARLAPLKGHDDLLAAAKAAIAVNPKLKFLLVGDGTLAESIAGQVRQLGLQDHFVFTGLVEPSAVPSMIAAMDVVVHTSLREGLARVLPQALLAGLPVISFDVDGAREVCIDHETGYLIPPRDVKLLSERMLQLAASTSERQRMGRAGQSRFSQQFDHKYMSGRIRQVYLAVLQANAVSREK